MIWYLRQNIHPTSRVSPCNQCQFSPNPAIGKGALNIRMNDLPLTPSRVLVHPCQKRHVPQTTIRIEYLDARMVPTPNSPRHLTRALIMSMILTIPCGSLLEESCSHPRLMDKRAAPVQYLDDLMGGKSEIAILSRGNVRNTLRRLEYVRQEIPLAALN